MDILIGVLKEVSPSIAALLVILYIGSSWLNILKQQQISNSQQQQQSAQFLERMLTEYSKNRESIDNQRDSIERGDEAVSKAIESLKTGIDAQTAVVTRLVTLLEKTNT